MCARILRAVGVFFVNTLTRNRVAAMSGTISDTVDPPPPSSDSNSDSPVSTTAEQDTLTDTTHPPSCSSQGASDTHSSDATSPSTPAITPEGSDNNPVDVSEPSVSTQEASDTPSSDAISLSTSAITPEGSDNNPVDESEPSGSTQEASDTPSSHATSLSTSVNSPEGYDNNPVGEGELSPVLEKTDQTRSTDQSRRLDDGDGDRAREDDSSSWRKYLLGFLKRASSSPTDSTPHRDRAYWDNLSLDDKRKQYKCGRDYVTLVDITTWEETRKPSIKPRSQSPYKPDTALNEKVSLWRGDITKLEIGAIVNAANSSLRGGGGVDGAIHRAAGRSLLDECITLDGCDTGDAKLTSGHRLPAKFILHTVGPVNCSERLLRSCYTNCLEIVKQEDMKSVAFCCIATGVYGYPNREAANVALKTVREWLETEDNADKVERIIFCVFLPIDNNIYNKLLNFYFPPETEEAGHCILGLTDPHPADNAAEREAISGCDQEYGGYKPPNLIRSTTEPAPTWTSATTFETISSVDQQDDQQDEQQEMVMDQGGAEEDNGEVGGAEQCQMSGDGEVGGAEHDQNGGDGKVGGAEQCQDSEMRGVEQDQDNEMSQDKVESMDEESVEPSLSPKGTEQGSPKNEVPQI